MPLSFDFDNVTEDDINDMYNIDSKAKIHVKKCSNCCCLATGVTIMNLLYAIGGYTFFYYMYLNKYIENIDDVIDGTFIENKEETNELLIKLPALVNVMCNAYGC